jgi:hypothetical protein
VAGTADRPGRHHLALSVMRRCACYADTGVVLIRRARSAGPVALGWRAARREGA